MKKFVFNQNIVKIISTIIIAIVIIIINLILTNRILNKVRNQSEELYKTSCKNIAEGYSNSITCKLNEYISNLDFFIDEKLFSNATNEEIHSYLIEKSNKKPVAFLNIFYADKNGNAFIDNGLTTTVSDRDYFNNIMHNGKKIDLDNPVISKTTGKMIIHISKPVYDSFHNVKGIISASITLTSLQEFFATIKNDDFVRVFLIDKEGRFIIHPDESYFMKSYTPINKEFYDFSSEKIALEGPGFFRSESTEGKEVDITLCRIEKTSWLIGVSVPEEQVNIIYNEQKKFRILLLFFTSLAIILLSIIELIFINSINYREHVETIYDSLTNLWTRQKFEKEVDRIIKHSPKDKFMLIESDIKNFKYINQTYGNQKADELIIFYSKLLQESVKDFKGIVSRSYSDHFYILIRIYSIYRAKKAFLDQLETLNKEINKFEITFIPKFGITFLKPNIDYNQISIKNLIGQASFTKSLLEENTFSQYGIYSSILLDKIKEERYIENHMNLALENEDFFIMYQPIMDIQSDKIIGAKPVIKWKDSEHGLINEDTFMPIFKRNGFISNLEFFVYKKVFNFLQNQINEKSSLVPILLTVSKIDLNYVDFMNKFSKLFLQYSIVPELIEIDLPEQVIFNQPQTNDLINFFHKLNIQIAVSDSSSCDFSLKTLHSKEIDVIKFNKNFIKIFESNDFDKSSLEFINYFLTECKNLKKRTIFTGIDNQSQDEILRELNCDYAQGDYYSRPLSESDFIQFIKLKF